MVGTFFIDGALRRVQGPSSRDYGGVNRSVLMPALSEITVSQMMARVHFHAKMPEKARDGRGSAG